MELNPVSPTTSWTPFGQQTGSQRTFGQLLALSGYADARLGDAPPKIDVSASGTITANRVISETTTVQITSSSAYTVQTESAAAAQSQQASGTLIDSAAGPSGSVNAVTPAGNAQKASVGQIEVKTTVEYADGSVATSEATLDSNFVVSGDGVAKERLINVIGGALSIDDVLLKLGIASQDAGADTAARTAPTADPISASVQSSVAVNLTYQRQGDELSISGTESGQSSAVIATLDPSQATYTAGAILSTTKESASFTAQIASTTIFTANGPVTEAVQESDIDHTRSDTVATATPNVDTFSQSTTVSELDLSSAVEQFSTASTTTAGTTVTSSSLDANGNAEIVQTTAAQTQSSAAVTTTANGRVKETTALSPILFSLTTLIAPEPTTNLQA